MAVESVTFSAGDGSVTLTADNVPPRVSDEEFRFLHDAQVLRIREARAHWLDKKGETTLAKADYDLQVDILEQLDDDRRSGRQPLPFDDK